MLRTLEVFYAKCIDGHDLDTGLVADFEDLAEALASHVDRVGLGLAYSCQRLEA